MPDPNPITLNPLYSKFFDALRENPELYPDFLQVRALSSKAHATIAKWEEVCLSANNQNNILRRDRMNNQKTSPLKLRKAFLYYVLCIGILLFSVSFLTLIFGSGSQAAAIGFWLNYAGLGIILNRFVLRRIIDWHPANKTIQNVSNTKLRTFLFWPMTYPWLFFRLAIIKIL